MGLENAVRLIHINDAVVNVFEEMTRRVGDDKGRKRLPTGFPNLDSQHGGVYSGATIGCRVAYAPVRHDLAASIALWHASRGANVILEHAVVPDSDVAARLIAAVANVPLWKLETAELCRMDWRSVAYAAGTLAKLNLHLAPYQTEPNNNPADEIIAKISASESQTIVIAADLPACFHHALAPVSNTQILTIAFGDGEATTSTQVDVRLECRTGSWFLSQGGPDACGERLPYDPSTRTFPTISRAFIDPESLSWQTSDYGLPDTSDDDRELPTVRLPEERRLEAEPPPPAGLRHFTQDELRQVIRWSHLRSLQLKDPSIEPIIGLFLTELMPRFKYAWHAGHEAAGITRSAMTQAARATLGGEVEYTAADLLARSGCVTEYTKPGHYDGTWRAASYRLLPGSIEFQKYAPRRRILDLPSSMALEERWHALQHVASDEAEEA